MPTNTKRTGRHLAPLFTCLIVGFASPGAFAQESRSAAAAKQLGEVLERLKLDSIAAADPTEKDTFVAALYFPGAQLLVVSAQYSAPSLLATKLSQKEYRDTYIDLNAASIASTKIFVMDQGADGLLARPDDSQPPDSWEHANKSTAFDGDWRKANISEEAYVKVFTSADEHYARMLTLLADQARKSGS